MFERRESDDDSSSEAPRPRTGPERAPTPRFLSIANGGEAFTPPPPEAVGIKPEEDDDDDDEEESTDTSAERVVAAPEDLETPADEGHAEIPLDTTTDQFEDMMLREMSPEFVEATSLSEEAAEQTAENEPQQEEDGTPALSSQGAGSGSGPAPTYHHAIPNHNQFNPPTTPNAPPGNTPPPPPGPPGPPAPPTGPNVPSGPNSGPNFNSGPQTSYNYNLLPPIQAPNVVNLGPNVLANPNRDSLRLRAAAWFLTGYAVKGFIERRRRNRVREENERAAEKQEQKITFLQHQQHEMQEKAKADTRANENERRAEQMRTDQKIEQLAKKPPVAEALPVVKTAEDEILFDDEGNKIVLQSGWRVERGTGGYVAVVNERGQVMYDAVRYGEAYLHDRRREQVNPAAFDNDDDAAGGQSTQDTQLLPFPGSAHGPVDPTHELQPGAPQSVDVQHRLPEPRNQLVATATSPWLWTAVALLLIIYFIAALA